MPVTGTLPQQVKRARDQLLAELAEFDPDAADRVRRVRAARGTTPSVVVVGETKRGKSSLVNALLDRPGLSPVDADAATACHLVFEHGPEWSARACYPDGSETGIDPNRLRERAVADPAPPEDAAAGIPGARELRIRAPLDPLAQLSLVDTPGAGGLTELHGELALEAAASATALLFAVDASAPLTRGELDFLQRAGERVETVVIALTKTDLHRGWREIAAENRELLTAHAPRFAAAPVFPVSARMLELAGRAPGPAAAAAVRAESGITELREHLLATVADRSAMLGEANTMRALRSALVELAARWAADRRALTAGEQEAAALRSRRAELTAARRSSTRGWQVRLRGEIQRTRVETGHEVTRQVREVQSWFRRAIDGADRGQLQLLPQQVDAALQLASTRVASGLSGTLSAVTEQALAELFSAEELDVIRAQFARGGRQPIALRPPDRRPPTAEDKLLVFMGVSGGLGIGRAAALPLAGLGVGGLSPVVLPVTIVLGLGAGWWMARTRKHTADKQHLKQWLTEAIADARSALDQLVAEQLIEAEQQLTLALDDALTRRIDAIDTELREVDKALRMDAAERTGQLQEVDRRIAAVTAGRERADQLLSSIRAVRDGR
ncbi:dynamin family protein [Saccharopolyspora sp. HNM0983]|uniref:Dynamin family protein n=1 Tax=Saccharopolyspora montiporae TaxID=2781240 RepID=A0A929B7K7_9PSEU|nr:dynamin family protein [Saccharopolyspora sp. HNM0983]MBE9374674.1 dynamin family protein [Saccharopolyspora sp. HNM0983]